jgi:hypothetical protein
MLANLLAAWRAASRFKDYRPHPVNLQSTIRWIKQFDKDLWPALRLLLEKILFMSELDTIKSLTSLNGKLLHRLSEAGINPEKVIYIQIDAAGSSSAAMLNLLRDSARLERKKCRLLDSKNVIEINEVTNELGEGAIIYVDDFIGTGRQLVRSQKRVREYVVGNFAEFVIAPCICEEGMGRLASIGVEPITDMIHLKRSRPLHPDSDILSPRDRKRISEVCLAMNPEHGLGFKGLATTVVFYRNSPNTVPLILRGNLNQTPIFGLMPRTTDLPL